MMTTIKCNQCDKAVRPQNEVVRQAASIISALLTDHPFVADGQDSIEAGLQWLDRHAPLPFTAEAGHCKATG